MALTLTGTPVQAADPGTEHTFALTEGNNRPSATIEDAAWLTGSWTGTAFGKRFEAVWNAPSAGTMVGLFKLMGDGQVDFYEILLISVIDGSLSLKVKHFTPDFVAWEEKADYTHFQLVKKAPDALHFGGLSFYRLNENQMEAFILMRNGEQIREEKLVYIRNSVGPGT